jgi:KipI family sensor histidine kinase inhibitor
MLDCFPSGDSALIIKAGNGISVETSLKVRQLLACMEKENIPGILDYIPSYNELMVCYDPSAANYHKIREVVISLESRLTEISLPVQRTIEVPVVYGGEYGPDLKDVALYNGLSEEEVIRIHSSVGYLVYMLGFTPGFCYLGGMNDRIAMPRKETPRLRIPEGAVGIADKQTGIYPVESPGGWQIIGRTPLKLFDPGRVPEFTFDAGDILKFVPVSGEDFNSIRAEILTGM